MPAGCRGESMSTALILVDIQRDYFPGGKMEVVGATEAGGRAAILLDYFRRKDLPVLHVRHVSTRPDAAFFLPGTEGLDFHENVLPLPAEKIITKHFPNSFRDTDLAMYLEAMKAEKLVICGMMSHMCIDATTRAAFDLGYDCIVAQDACATRDLEFQGMHVPAAHVHAAFMAALGAVYAKVVSVREMLESL